MARVVCGQDGLVDGAILSADDKWLYLLYGLYCSEIRREGDTLPVWPDCARTFQSAEGAAVALSSVSVVDHMPMKRGRSPAHIDPVYVVAVAEGERCDALADHFAEALTATMTLVADDAHDDPFVAVPLSIQRVRQQALVLRSDLPPDPRRPWLPVSGPAHSWSCSTSTLNSVWETLPAFLADPGRLLQAGNLYRESILHAWVADDDVFEFRNQGIKSPASASDRIRLATAYHVAFKALEALLGGEPPKDPQGLRQRLVSNGMDPDEVVGYPHLEPEVPRNTVLRKIGDMHETRDKVAAHGGLKSRRSSIGYVALKDTQALVRHLILRVVAQYAMSPAACEIARAGC